MKEKLEEIKKEYSISPSNILTVSQLSDYISETIDSDPELQSVFLMGEVSNLYSSNKENLFFDLKDEGSKVSCVIFRWERKGLEYEPEDGDEILIRGKVDYYEKEGEISVKPTEVLPIGEGVYYKELKKLTKKLRKEGLFDEEYKTMIPEIPEKIGMVTSKDGDALRDMVNSIRDRFPEVNIYVRHASVQGDDAIDDICKGIDFFDKRFDVDVIITGRGGGSIEDLQAFNSEEVARKIFATDTPVISGVGHRTDETITGYVADCGAITPTAAGKAAVPDKKELMKKLDEMENEVKEKFKKFKKVKKQEKEIEVATWRERKYQIVIVVLVAILMLLIWVAL